jgi:hypothetical protein
MFAAFPTAGLDIHKFDTIQGRSAKSCSCKKYKSQKKLHNVLVDTRQIKKEVEIENCLDLAMNINYTTITHYKTNNKDLVDITCKLKT